MRKHVRVRVLRQGRRALVDASALASEYEPPIVRTFMSTKVARLRVHESGIRGMAPRIAKIAIGPVRLASDERIPLPVMVCAHERSGTHFLMNSIAKNSIYRNDPFLNYDLDPLGSFVNFHYTRDVRLFFEHIAAHCCASIIKSHFAAEFFAGSEREYVVSRSCKTIYIVRDPLDVMASYRRLIDHLPWREGPKGLGIFDFVNAPPQGRMVRYQAGAFGTILERWAAHVLGWLKIAENEPSVLLMTYDELDRNHDRATRRILSFLGVSCPDAIVRPNPIAQTTYVPKNGRLSDDERARVREHIIQRIGHSEPLTRLFPDLFRQNDCQPV
jgi:hypothetical protein